ncbi:MAG TPA: AMP-binding protein [Steroidobacteraceae bacterium]|nr:AMP-binding protein [Steroidobacteraceae bacterium]
MRNRWLDAYPPGTPSEIDPDAYPSLVSILEESCRRFADCPAFHNLGVALSYRDLDRLSRDFGAFLLRQGLERGDRVALMMPNVLSYPIAMFGALRAGLVVVNVNPLYTPRELRHQLRDSGARAIVILENFAHVLAQVYADTDIRQILIARIGDLAPFPKRPVVNFLVRRIKRLIPPYHLPGAQSFRRALTLGAQCSWRPPEIAPEDVAFLQYTGGTTGVAKGAKLTHRNMVANLLQVAAFWKSLIEPGREVIITPLPLYHIFCLTCNCLVFMQHGGLIVLITNPRDLDAFVHELKRWRFSMITGVNTLYRALLDHPGFAQIDFSHFKLAAAGGMALHPSVAERWRALTGRPLIEGYGLTECSPVVACNSFLAPRLGSVGVPLPSTEISIRDNEVEVPAGQPGELWVRGPQVMRGYWNRPEDTAKALTSDGWLRTGDVAVMEPDGFLRIVDRIKDLIVVSGFKVFPNEIEEIVAEHVAVAECGCIGVPDAYSGEAVKIFVVLREGHSSTPEDLLEYCRQHLTGYKIPKHVEFRSSLPKTHVGKILRRELASEQTPRAA